jgi:membrane protein DedA with SNARE-associated domain
MQETQGIIANIGAYSYLGVFVISILANVIVPIPEEIVIVAIGYVAATGVIDPFIAIPFVILGALTSDTVMYLLARRGTKLLTTFYDKFFAKLIGHRTEWVENSTHEVVFYSRFMVQLRFLGPFIAGQRKMKLRTFFTYELAALVVYVPLLILVGDYFRDRFELIVSGIGTVKNIFLLIIGILILISFSRLVRDIIFGGYTLAFKGTKKERTLVPGIYKVKK